MFLKNVSDSLCCGNAFGGDLNICRETRKYTSAVVYARDYMSELEVESDEVTVKASLLLSPTSRIISSVMGLSESKFDMVSVLKKLIIQKHLRNHWQCQRWIH